MNPKFGARRERGFTLVEAIMAIVITGILSVMVAVFIKAPVEGYFDTVRRAKLTDEADTSLRFIARELHAALPNSISCTSAGGSATLSFRSIRSGGRYRENETSAGAGNPLQFGTGTSGYDTIGGGGDATLKDAHGATIASGTAAIGNLGSGVAVCDATQTSPSNTPAVTALAAPSVTFSGTPTVPGACDLQLAAAPDPNDRLPGRFYMIDPSAVAYACGATGLTRNGARMSDRVSSCQIACIGMNATVQTISIGLTLTDSGESMTLFRQIHVENYP